MKKLFVLLAFIFVINLIAIAQNRVGRVNQYSSMSEFSSYFEDNICDLDPIEGIYELKIESYAGDDDGYIGSENEECKIAIYKTSNGDRFMITNGKGDLNRYYIEREDENRYILKVKYPAINREYSFIIIRSNSTYFKVTHTIPFEQILHDLGSRKNGYYHGFKWKASKEYPY